MITRKNAPLFLFDVRVLVSAVAVAYLAGTACNSAALLAPTNSTISLTAGNRVLPNGGTTQLLATVLENSGQPVPNGTTVRFTASMGRVDPAEAETNNGVAVATFVAGSESGIAEIRAISGLASGGTGTTTTPGTGGTPTTTTAAANVVQITIGAAAVRGITLSANPGTLRPSGSSVEISAFVNDGDGNPVRSVPVTFTTTRGTVSPALATTDSDGIARTTLTGSETATVTGRVGGGGSSGGGTGGGTNPPPTGGTGVSDDVEVRTATTPSFSLTTTPASPTAGQPVVLTISPGVTTTPGTPGTPTTPGTGGGSTSSAPSVTINWGDGTVEAAGVVSATRSVTHIYAAPGFYTITATGTQEGESFTTSTAVTVSSPPPVSLTVSPTTADVGVPITFTITPTVGALIQNITINYGDGQTETLGAVSTQNTRTHQYSSPGVYVVTVTQVEVSGRQTTATTTVTITS